MHRPARPSVHPAGWSGRPGLPSPAHVRRSRPFRPGGWRPRPGWPCPARYPRCGARSPRHRPRRWRRAAPDVSPWLRRWPSRSAGSTPPAGGCRRRPARPTTPADRGWTAGMLGSRPRRRRPAGRTAWAAASCLRARCTASLAAWAVASSRSSPLSDSWIDAGSAGRPSSADCRSLTRSVAAVSRAAAVATAPAALDSAARARWTLVSAAATAFSAAASFGTRLGLGSVATVCSHTGQASPTARCGRSNAALLVTASSSSAARASTWAASGGVQLCLRPFVLGCGSFVRLLQWTYRGGSLAPVRRSAAVRAPAVLGAGPAAGPPWRPHPAALRRRVQRMIRAGPGRRIGIARRVRSARPGWSPPTGSAAPRSGDRRQPWRRHGRFRRRLEPSRADSTE